MTKIIQKASAGTCALAILALFLQGCGGGSGTTDLTSELNKTKAERDVALDAEATAKLAEVEALVALAERAEASAKQEVVELALLNQSYETEVAMAREDRKATIRDILEGADTKLQELMESLVPEDVSDENLTVDQKLIKRQLDYVAEDLALAEVNLDKAVMAFNPTQTQDEEETVLAELDKVAMNLMTAQEKLDVAEEAIDRALTKAETDAEAAKATAEAALPTDDDREAAEAARRALEMAEEALETAEAALPDSPSAEQTQAVTTAREELATAKGNLTAALNPFDPTDEQKQAVTNAVADLENAEDMQETQIRAVTAAEAAVVMAKKEIEDATVDVPEWSLADRALEMAKEALETAEAALPSENQTPEELQEAVTAAKAAVDAAETNERDALAAYNPTRAQLQRVEDAKEDLESKREVLDEALMALKLTNTDQLQAVMSAQEMLETAQDAAEGDLVSLTVAENAVKRAQVDLKTAQDAVPEPTDEQNLAVTDAEAALVTAHAAVLAGERDRDKENLPALRQAETDANAALATARDALPTPTKAQLDAVTDAKAVLATADQKRLEAETAFIKTPAEVQAVTAAETALATAKGNIATPVVNMAMTELTNAQEDILTPSTAQRKAVTDAEMALATAQEDLVLAMEVKNAFANAVVESAVDNLKLAQANFDEAKRKQDVAEMALAKAEALVEAEVALNEAQAALPSENPTPAEVQAVEDAKASVTAQAFINLIDKKWYENFLMAEIKSTNDLRSIVNASEMDVNVSAPFGENGFSGTVDITFQDSSSLNTKLVLNDEGVEVTGNDAVVGKGVVISGGAAGDADFYAGGAWFVARSDLSYNAYILNELGSGTHFGAFVQGTDPYDAVGIAGISGEIVYLGNAEGLYTTEVEELNVESFVNAFQAEVSLGVTFNNDQTPEVEFTIRNFSGLADNVVLNGFTLAGTGSIDATSLDYSGRESGEEAYTAFDGSFYGNAAQDNDKVVPESVAGTFSYDDAQNDLLSYWGVYQADKQ